MRNYGEWRKLQIIVEGVDKVLSGCVLLTRTPMPLTHGNWQSSLAGLRLTAYSINCSLTDTSYWDLLVLLPVLYI